MMKRFTIILALILLISLPGQSSRIIKSFDIARWYLDADLVLICSVNRIDTIFFRHYDSISIDNIHEKYDLVKEKYNISIDSIIKGDILNRKIADTIKTPDFIINYSKTQPISKEFSGFNSDGDSIFQIEVKMFDDNAYFDFSYFRLDFQRKYLVILRKTNTGYLIDYESEINEDILKLIEEVKSKGESYFPSLPDNKI